MDYKTLVLTNNYNEDNITETIPVLNKAGVEAILEDNLITLNFDSVDVKYIERQHEKIKGLLSDPLAELMKIRSFSTSNGKVVFASFNKNKKTSEKNKTSKNGLVMNIVGNGLVKPTISFMMNF